MYKESFWILKKNLHRFQDTGQCTMITNMLFGDSSMHATNKRSQQNDDHNKSAHAQDDERGDMICLLVSLYVLVQLLVIFVGFSWRLERSGN